MTREEAIEILTKTGYTDRELDFYEALDVAIEALQELPKRRKEAKRWKTKALKAEPVKHGEWEKDRLLTTKGGGYDVIRCSECKSQFPIEQTNYCPNCGAKMDKEVNNE